MREVKRKGKHGIQLSPELDDIFILLFADDVVLHSDSTSGLQNQLDILKSTADDLGLQVKQNWHFGTQKRRSFVEI